LSSSRRKGAKPKSKAIREIAKILSLKKLPHFSCTVFGEVFCYGKKTTHTRGGKE
jgi:hypothetical protein